MKKKLFFGVLMLLLLLFSLGGCDISNSGQTANDPPPYVDEASDANGTGTDSGTETTGGKTDQNASDSKDQKALKTFCGVVVTPVFSVFDGEKHVPTVTGYPAGTQITFSADPVNVGEYEIGVTLSADGYETLSLASYVTITPASLDYLSFQDLLVYYDGKNHALAPVSNVPNGASVQYFRVVNGQKAPINANGLCAAEAGTYIFAVEITLPNYKDFSATAALKIKEPSNEILIEKIGNTLFYQKASDGYALYVNENVKVTSDLITAIYQKNENTYLFLNTSASPITLYEYKLTEDFKVEKDGVTAIFSDNIEEFLFLDDHRVIYSVGIKEAGIYEVDLLSTSGIHPKRIYEGNVENLLLIDDKSKLYFTNSDKNDELTSIDLSLPSRLVTSYSLNHLDDFLIVGDDVFGGVSGEGTVVYHLGSDVCDLLSSDVGFDFCADGDTIYFLSSGAEISPYGGKTIYRYKSQTGELTVLHQKAHECMSSLTYTNGLYYLSDVDMLFVDPYDMPY